MRCFISMFCGALIALVWASPSQATLVTTMQSFTGSSGTLSAEADFTLVTDTSNGTGTLTVTLTNTSKAAVTNPAAALTALEFNTSHTLSPVVGVNGATLGPGSTVVSQPVVANIGEGWVYESPVNAQQGMNSGISASGLSPTFGNTGYFYTPAQTPLDGVNYGIVSNSTTSADISGNGGLSNGPLINDSVVFQLTAVSGFSLAELGSTVVFQYGTATSDTFIGGGITPFTTTPEPSTIALALSGLLSFGVIRLRRRTKGAAA